MTFDGEILPEDSRCNPKDPGYNKNHIHFGAMAIAGVTKTIITLLSLEPIVGNSELNGSKEMARIKKGFRAVTRRNAVNEGIGDFFKQWCSGAETPQSE